MLYLEELRLEEKAYDKIRMADAHMAAITGSSSKKGNNSYKKWQKSSLPKIKTAVKSRTLFDIAQGGS